MEILYKGTGKFPRARSESVVGSGHLFLWASPGAPCAGRAVSPQTISIKAAGRAGAVAGGRLRGFAVLSRFRDFAIVLYFYKNTNLFDQGKLIS